MSRRGRNFGASYISLSTKHNNTNCARKAVEALTQAREISHSLLDAKGQADAANNLGVALCSLRDFKRVIACLSEALEYYEQTGQDEQASLTRWHRQEARQAAGIE